MATTSPDNGSCFIKEWDKKLSPINEQLLRARGMINEIKKNITLSE